MTTTLVRIYALLVCFVSIVCIAITTGIALYNMVSVISPELTISPYRYEHLATGTQIGGRLAYPGQMIPNKMDDLSEEELAELREQQLEIALQTERKSAISSLIRLMIILAVTIPLYFVHWRIANRDST